MAMADCLEHTFWHEAMGAIFRITVAHRDAHYARQAVADAWDELDRLEARLSRFIPSSDIARIGRLAAGQETVVHPDTWQCLRIAAQVEADTDGAFDIAYAMRSGRGSGRLWEVDRQRPAVRVLASGLPLDLGGIGKGFALDRLAALLADWEVNRALLDAGQSTLLAREPPPGRPGWAIRLGEGAGSLDRSLCRRAIAASGTAMRGAHIIDPHTGAAVRTAARVWVVAESAARADALSTALLVLGPQAAGAFCRRRHIEAYWQEGPAQAPRALTL